MGQNYVVIRVIHQIFPAPLRHMLLLLLSCFNRVQLCATLYIAAHQSPLSLGFSRQEYWSGLPFPSPMHACMLRHFSHSNSVQPYGQQHMLGEQLLCTLEVGYGQLTHPSQLNLVSSAVFSR